MIKLINKEKYEKICENLEKVQKDLASEIAKNNSCENCIAELQNELMKEVNKNEKLSNQISKLEETNNLLSLEIEALKQNVRKKYTKKQESKVKVVELNENLVVDSSIDTSISRVSMPKKKNKTSVKKVKKGNKNGK